MRLRTGQTPKGAKQQLSCSIAVNLFFRSMFDQMPMAAYPSLTSHMTDDAFLQKQARLASLEII
jgi:hypothetical protein